MNIDRLRTVLISALVTVCSLGAAHAQSVTVNTVSCPAATVTLGAGTIAINTAGCGGSGPALTAPAFTSGAPTGTGNANAPYNFTFTASGNPAPTFGLVSGDTLPAGMTLSSAGVLSGTPTGAGTATFAVQATNSQGSALSPASGKHTVVISNLPAITSAVPANATATFAFSHTFTASQTIPAAGWSVSAGTLPGWVTLTNTGVLSGTPAAANVGSTNFTVSATNANGTASQAVTLTVILLTPPTITAFAPPAGTANSVYTYSFGANGTSPITWTLNSGILPTGLTLATSGALTGTPTVAGTYTFTVRAANAAMPDAISSSIMMVINAAQALGPIAADINSNLIPTPVSKNPKVGGAVHAPPMGGGNFPGGEIRAWSVNPSHCAGLSTPAVTTLWYHNINFLDYGGQNATENVEFAPHQALVYGFTAPSIGTYNGYIGNIDVQTGATGTPAPTFVSISSSPCDFDVTKLATATACYASTAGAENGFGFRITNGATTACKLIPGNRYYLNFRFQDGRPAPVGSPTLDGCAATQGAASCGAIMRISITNVY